MARSHSDDDGGDDDGTDAAVGAEVARLRRDNALLVALLESASELVYVLAPDGKLLRTFRSRGRPLGYEPDELEGRDVLQLVHPDDAHVARAAFAKLVQSGPGAVAQIEVRLRRHDGTWVPMECNAENRTADPVVRGVVVCSRDVSARLELERKLRLAQRMESVGRVASGIVHDFNNLLSVILFSADRLRAAPLPAQPQRDAVEEIARAAERGSSLTKRLLSFVRDRPVRPRPVDLGALVAAQEWTLRSLLPDDVRLTLRRAEGPLPVVADPAELEHVLLNLVLNARDAMQGGGTVQVETRLEPGGDSGAMSGIAPALRGGAMVAVLEVRDEGHGMDDATRRRLFEPFFTTKSAERGTGLGLWTVQDVVSRHGGSIEVNSAVDLGTVLRVRLPLAAAAVVPDERDRGSRGSRPQAPLRILVVDDETRLLELFGAALEDEGHTVHLASDGIEALEIVDRLSIAPDLLVSDVSMPRLGGPELAARLRLRWPELPVLLVSGYGDVAPQTSKDAATALLAKPFTAEELRAAIAALIGVRAVGAGA